MTYRTHLERDILPWWLERGPDAERGGVLTCWDNLGNELISRDKYTWSQGRWVWLAATMADAARAGHVTTDADAWAETAARTTDFLLTNAFLPDGTTAYLLDETGTAREPVPGGGLHISIFTDCFVALGLARWARSAGSTELADRSETLLASIVARIDAGAVVTSPHVTPAGHGSFALPMITIGVAGEVHRTTGSAASAAALKGACDALLRDFIDGDDAAEMPVIDERGRPDSLTARHRTPGHTLECLWFLVDDAAPVVPGHELTDPHRLAGIAKHSLALGWDPEHGGLLHHVDVAGGPPVGHVGDPGAEHLARTWDTKLWWPHAEAVYTTELLLGRTATAAGPDPELADWRDRVRDWTTATFPVGPGQEWVQIRDRDGSPRDEVVALPVKDPFHIARAWWKLAELERTDAIVG
ncbi:AGE family epimerase/isomerase [Propionibacteriaceae bacterium Y2011]